MQDIEYVTKRDGTLQNIDFNKVQTRITNLCLGRINIDGQLVILPPLQHTNPVMISQVVINGIKNKITTSELDQLALETAANRIVRHYEYDTLAARIGVSDLQKSTSSTLLECSRELYNTHDSRGRHKPLIAENVWGIIQEHHEYLESLIDYKRDYYYKFFGLQTLRKIYLLKKNDQIIERPQHMIMRLSIGLYGDNLGEIKDNYELMSNHFFTHATPTIFNGGTPKPTLISCFLLQISDDSIEGIYETVKKFAIISAGSGGIGFHQHILRAANSQIYGSNGKTDNIVKFLRVLNEETIHVNQGGRRPASFASYLEFWHDDIMDWIRAKRNTGEEKNRARRLFYGAWIPDLFMERAANDEVWSLMSPDDCPGLSDCYGDQFKELYEKYESEGKFRRQIQARELMDELITTELETGMPYICFKDHANRKTNQQNIGTIKSSNLCVSGDTKILTDQGYQRIDKCVGKPTTIWNGYEWSDVKPFKTGEGKQLLNIKFSDGSELKCTEYHKFYIASGYRSTKIDAKDLRPGMKLVKHKFPVLKEIDQKLQQFEEFCDDCYRSKLLSVKNGAIQIAGFHPKFLQAIKLTLNTFGLSPEITSGEHCLLIDPMNVYNLVKLGFSPKKFNVNVEEPINESKKHVSIVSVEKIVGQTFDTYCFTEPKKHMGIFNGVLTGQCSEIMEYSDPNETACCVLASIALPKFVQKGTNVRFDYQMFERVVTRMVKGLNKVIDINKYTTDCAKVSNMKHRPLGIGVQGLADLFYMFRTTYDQPLAKQLNREIFEALYYYAMKASMELAKVDGPYDTFEGSPVSQGIFQFDMWGVDPSNRFDWTQLKEDVKQHGVRNSLLIALMPTATTSQLLGNSECIEPYNSNVFARSTLAGIFQVVNRFLMEDLINLGLWNDQLCNAIIANNGSIQNIDGIPETLKQLYKTAWELKMKNILDMSAERGAFVCQSQSLNLFKELKKPKSGDQNADQLITSQREQLRRMYFYAWRAGLKTGQYYLRSRPAKDPIRATVNVADEKRRIAHQPTQTKTEKKYITLPNGLQVVCEEEVCTMCDG